MSIHLEVFLAMGYSVFLLTVAMSLDLVSRHSHKRSERYHSAGFTYHPTHDAWICPEDQPLLRSEVDHERRLVRYRARSIVCNHCPAKTDCTDSDEGRELTRAMDPWPHSEAGRFHRGISLVIASIAVPILAAEAIRNHSPLELTILGTLSLMTVLVTWRLHAAFRAAPANFPTRQAAPPGTPPAKGSPTGYGESKGVRR